MGKIKKTLRERMVFGVEYFLQTNRGTARKFSRVMRENWRMGNITLNVVEFRHKGVSVWCVTCLQGNVSRANVYARSEDARQFYEDCRIRVQSYAVTDQLNGVTVELAMNQS